MAEALSIANLGWGERGSDPRPLYTQKGGQVTDRSVKSEQYGRFLSVIFDEWVRQDVGTVYVQMFDVTLGAHVGQHSLCVFAPTCGNALAMEHNCRGGAEGVILSQGGNDGGYSLYVQDGTLCYAYNYVGRTRYHVEAAEAVPAGRHQLRFEFEVTGNPDIAHGKGAAGRGQLYIDGKLVGQSDIELTNPLAIGLLSAIVCGADPGAPLTPHYKPPFPFTGTIYSVTMDVSGERIKDTVSEMRVIMARQ